MFYLKSKDTVNANSAKTWTLRVLDMERPLSCALQLRKCACQRKSHGRLFVWRRPLCFTGQAVSNISV